MIAYLFLLEQGGQGIFLDTYNRRHSHSLTLEDSHLGGLFPDGKNHRW